MLRSEAICKSQESLFKATKTNYCIRYNIQLENICRIKIALFYGRRLAILAVYFNAQKKKQIVKFYKKNS